MKLPAVSSVIERRLLVNYRVDPAAAARLLPGGQRPQLVRGWAVAGICLIRLGGLRPRWAPAWSGLRTENAAHRVAVEWDAPSGTRAGVYIPRRDSDSLVSVLAGGRLFPGEHHRARFDVRENAADLHVAYASADGTTRVSVDASVARELNGSELFDDLDGASEFFRQGATGFSGTSDQGRLDGVELNAENWVAQPADVHAVSSSFFEDRSVFPQGSAKLDCALVMRDIPATWCALALPGDEAERHHVDLRVVGQVRVVAAQADAQAGHRAVRLEPRLLRCHLVQAVPLDASYLPAEGAVRLVFLEDEQGRANGDGVVEADRAGLRAVGHGVVVPLVEPDDAPDAGVRVVVGAGQQLADWQYLQPRGSRRGLSPRSAFRYRDEDVRVQVEQDLPAPAARRDQPAPVVPRSRDHQQRPRLRRRRDPEHDKLGTGPAGEVVHVHRRVDPARRVHRRSRDRVMLIGFVQRPGQPLRRSDHQQLRLKRIHAQIIQPADRPDKRVLSRLVKCRQCLPIGASESPGTARYPLIRFLRGCLVA
jgi:hypothetical protein